MNVLLTNDVGEIAELSRRELTNSIKLDKSLDHDISLQMQVKSSQKFSSLPDDLNFNEHVIDVPKASNEIFQLTRRVRVNKNIERDTQEDDQGEDAEWW